MRKLASWENKALGEQLAETQIRAPVYVTGLARSGSTILLELLNAHPAFASHRYRDFPAVMTPWMWNWFVDKASRREAAPAERAHKDRLKVTPESPEAFEEVLWMNFFEGLHGGGADEVLDEETSNPEFEAFYRDHIRKILMIRGGARYLAKANYHVTRLAYLHKLFPDARFVVPIRDPVWHIASLMKQHSLFTRQQAYDPRVLDHFRRAGHFEFGLGRRAIAVGPEGGEDIEQLWKTGEEAAGWAALWNLVYGHLAHQLQSNPELLAATVIVRYEDLCANPRATFGDILAHCGLKSGGLADLAASTLSAPDYYQPKFSRADLDEIEARTRATARLFGYQVREKAAAGS
ncbi:sulfotransferase [Methyloligella sp. GL2]|nr:sulfotransferase [Methyloligella sp. GL2]